MNNSNFKSNQKSNKNQLKLKKKTSKKVKIMTEATEAIKEIEELENYDTIKQVYKWFKSCFTCENQISKRTRTRGGAIERGEGCQVESISKNKYMKHRLPLTDKGHKDCEFYEPTQEIITQYQNYEQNKNTTFHRIFHDPDFIDD